MAKVIYETNEYDGYGKHNHYHYKYVQDGDEITKIKCHRQKFFNGDENEWEYEETEVESWTIGDPSMPEWLNDYIE